MELFIWCFITLVVLGAANPNPQTGIFSSSVPKFGDRLKTPELTLYLTQDVIKALQNMNLSKKPASSVTPDQNTHIKEYYNQEGQIYAQQSHPKKTYKKKQGFISRFFLPRDKDVIENQDNNIVKFYVDSLKNQKDIYKQNSQHITYNKEIQMTNDFQYIPASYGEEEILEQEQLEQQWNRILDHNRAQLQGLSAFKHQNDHNNQVPPILIHSEVRITKHHPVPVYKLVDILPKTSS